jgi:adenylate kinase
MSPQNKKSASSRIILITGVPGVGKTSIAQKIAENHTLPIINFGDILFTKVKTKYKNIQNVDEMRTKLSRERYKDMQLLTAQEIVATPGDKIITSHLSIDTPIGFMPGFPRQIVDILRPDMIIIIESPMKEIKARRENDLSCRDRSHKLEMWIEFHQQYNRAMAASYSFYTGNYCFPVMNRQGEIEEAYQELNFVIDKLMSSPADK